MTLDPRCPSCGHVNEAPATQCAQCNFPLSEKPAVMGDPPPRPERPAPADISMARIRPIRPRRPGAAQDPMQRQLYILFGGLTFVAVVLWVLWTAYSGYQKNNAPAAVEGASPQQQQTADMERAAVARDSTDINAQIALANVLYDTANWSEAIIHYRAAQRLDSTRVTTLVDMGVCYYNLSDSETAMGLFRKALTLDPRQPVALFNMGIVSENAGKLEDALKFYHQAMNANPAPEVATGVNEALTRVMGKLGRKAPAMPPGASGGMPGGAPGGR